MIRRILSSFPMLLLLSAACAGGFYFVNTDANPLEPAFGTSAKTVGTQIMVLLTTLSVGFWILVQKWSWRYRLLALLVPASIWIGLVGVARRIGFNGNNELVIDYRWDPTDEERLAKVGLLPEKEENFNRTADLSADLLQGPACESFLGPNHDGYVDESMIADDTSLRHAKEVWRLPIGGGYASFAVAGRLAVTIEQRGPWEVVVAYDVQDGKALWQVANKALFSEMMGGDGPRATPTIAGQNVYSLGATGHLQALELLSGKVLWAANVLTDADASNIQWGMSGSPLVTDRLVIVNPGGKTGKGVVAYDRATGQIVWAQGDHQAAYASPVQATIQGVEQVIIQSADTLSGHDLATGKELWQTPFAPMNGIAVGQPLALPGDRVFTSASYGAGAKMIHLSKNEEGAFAVDLVWENKSLRCKFSSPIHVNGYIYGLDDGILVCIDAGSGERKWKKGRYGHGQMLYAAGKLFIQAETGDFVIVATNPAKHEELASWKSLPGIKNWNAPALAGKNLLVRNHLEMALYTFSAPPATTAATESPQ
ncbi:PQQ-like beta-propeller repeat protein [bacterium]|nr:PQQ-like beta-propeller repeat protein [bacterium]